MVRYLFFIFLLLHCAIAQNGKNQSKTWMTLDGGEPLVIARGGYFGLFPDSSNMAFTFAIDSGSDRMVTFCDLQLTKDSQGFCLTGLQLSNTTIIENVFPNEKKSYDVNGQNVEGWFAVDYTLEKLREVPLKQGIYVRTQVFDGISSVSTIKDVTSFKPSPSHIWLNVQYPSFLKQHKLDPTSYVEKTLRVTKMEYISSPEIGFLKALKTQVKKPYTNFIFQFLEKDMIEKTTNQTYGSILKNLSSIKSFASGILVPKDYIWPVSKSMCLDSATTLVTDAHKIGLKVYASDFVNDDIMSYNYSYDPTAEYLQFIDNSKFSVDGVLTDFPSTASESIECLAHNKNATRPSKGPLIISHNGASGVFSGSTDLAYEQAIADGADIIDCTVQLSKDGVPFCLESPDLLGETNAAQTLISRSKIIPEIQEARGVFSFDLTWSEIQSLQPQIEEPFYRNYGLRRNPANKNKGKFITLSPFLQLAQRQAATGILINIQVSAAASANFVL